MDIKTFDLFKIDDNKEKKLWNNCVFVFDSCALLDFYFLPKKTREKIYSEIFSKLNNRLWLPAQVQYEYLKNREKTITKPIADNYDPLKNNILNIEKTITKELVKQIEAVENLSKNDNQHPHIEQEDVIVFKKNIADFIKKVILFKSNSHEKIKKAEKEIIEIKNDDDVLKALETYFQVGNEFTFDQVLKITKEGKHRYEFKIPPGYGDLNKKKGIQIFGDLIIWKEILNFSKQNDKNVIFITNDITKDNDWCYPDKNNRIQKPREELIKEFNDFSGKEFWMYSLTQFLFLANKLLDAEIEEENIDFLSQSINQRTRKKLIIECSHCGTDYNFNREDLALEFKCIESSKRSMGQENHYEAIEEFQCRCGNNMILKFEIWEYPIGAHNYDTVNIENGKIIECFDNTYDFHYSIIFSCEKCGNDSDNETGTGLCGRCETEYNEN